MLGLNYNVKDVYSNTKRSIGRANLTFSWLANAVDCFFRPRRSPIDAQRFEVPLFIRPSSAEKPANPKYEVRLGEGEFGFFFEVGKKI